MRLGTGAAAAWIASFALAAAAAHDAGTADEIAGTWLTEDGSSRVQIARAGAGYAGKVVWLKEPERDGKPVTDVKNKDASLRGRAIMGLEILSGLAYAGDRTWRNGTIYSPRQGRSYGAEAAIAGDGRLDIKVKDGVFTKRIAWTRSP